MSISGSNKRKIYSHNCSYPWTSLIVDPMGEISFCCFHPAIANINNITKNLANDVWNGSVAKELRRKWNEGNLKGTPCDKCDGLRQYKKYEYPIKNIPNKNNSFCSNARFNFNEFCSGEVILKSKPVEIIYVPSILCNINCIHCFQAPNRKQGKYSCIKPGSLSKFYNYLGDKAIRNVFSGGEPFIIKEVQLLINKLNLEQKEEGVFLTNGMLIKDKYELTNNFRKRSFIISIDAFEKNRYERIQKGASFDKLLDNLEFLNNQRAAGEDINLTLVMVLMKSNFIDLKNIFNFARKYKFDKVWIAPVGNLTNNSFTKEDIFKLPYLLEKIPLWQELLDEGISQAKRFGYETAFNHLEYIKSRLLLSVARNRCRSINNYFLWVSKKTVKSFPLIEKSLKQILRINFIKKIYRKLY
jgi:radical SAM protein with 4Fe4S-binding SPASM domain